MTSHEISLSGKSALITGGSAGIGLSVAEKLCRAGNAVAIVARKKEQLNEAEQYLKACVQNAKVLAIQCDVSKVSNIKEMVTLVENHFGTIDILVNMPGPIR